MKRLRQVMSFLRPFRGALILAGILTGVLTLIGMAPPLLMKGLINDVARQGNWGLFPLLIVGLFAVPVLRGLVNIITTIALNKAGVGIIRETRSRVFRHLMRLTMRFYNEMPAGAIQQRLVPDVANISSIATGGMVTLLSDVVSIVFAVIVMLMLSWQLSLMTFALLPLYYLNYWFFSKKIEAANVQLRSRMDHISSTLQERLSAHELIQSYGQEKQEASHFSSQAKQIMDAAVRGSAYNISFNQLADFLNKVGNTGIYCAGCYFLVLGWMGYGDVVAFCAYATLLVGPVIRFATVANQFVQVGVSVDRVQELLNRKPAIEEAPDAAPVEALRGDVKVDGVTYGFGEGKPVLQGVHL